MADGEQAGTGDGSILDPERWVDEYGDFLFNLAYSRLHDRAASEDAVQETFLAALKGSGGFEGRSKERTWLVAILKRKIVDQLRTRFRESAPEPEESVSDERLGGFNIEGEWLGCWGPDNYPVDWDSGPERVFEKREFWASLGDCLNELPIRMRTVFILHEIESLPSEETCKELGITPTNLWVIVHRARHRLRLCLERKWMKPGKRESH